MMSAFFMHDLKNLGSKLSLVTQNLPVHFDNPEFRQDAIRSVTQSVAKINNMCSKLSLLSQRLEIHPRQASLDRLVTDAMKSLDGMFKVPVLCSLGNVNRPAHRRRADSEGHRQPASQRERSRCGGWADQYFNIPGWRLGTGCRERHRLRHVARVHRDAPLQALPDDEAERHGDRPLPLQDDRGGPRRPDRGGERGREGDDVSGFPARKAQRS